MKWIEVTVTTNQEASDAVSDVLLALGANGVEMVDPEAFARVLSDNSHLDYADAGFMDQFGTDVVIKAYYQDGRTHATLEAAIAEGLSNVSENFSILPGTLSLCVRDDVEWKDVWKDYYKPFEIAPGYIVKPSWETYDVRSGETVIEMDPGMAFGTGTHETTKMCAEFAVSTVQKGDTVMDIGCGTAILAMIAAYQGAENVLAIDIDDAAVKTASENVLRNGLTRQITVQESVLSDVPPFPYDVLLVNIIADVIIDLAPIFPEYLKPNGSLVVSGIIHGRVSEVITTLEQNGFNLSEHNSQGEWDAMVFQCIGS